MGDGWETRRRRTPGNDWIIIALGARGLVEAIEVDTAHYKGNFPDSCSILGGDMPRGGETLEAAVTTASMFWPELLPPQKLSADAIHKFGEVKPIGPITHIRLNIFPDGGISRIRVLGKLAE
jgi:allantoicase